MNIQQIKNELLSFEEVVTLIQSGRHLLIAGDEHLLEKLPNGNWIGGTIPYFMASQGALSTKEKIFVTILPEFFVDPRIVLYSNSEIENVYKNAPENGITYIIIPATSDIHLSFALNSPQYEEFGMTPLIGWVSGIHLDDLGKDSAKVFYGPTAEKIENKAVVIHAGLPESKYAEINIINIFEQGNGDRIEFLEDGFSATDALINGVKRNFFDYIKESQHDIRFPLVANYQGVMINISYQNLDEEHKIVTFYGPVFKDMEYKNSEEIKDYVSEFSKQIPTEDLENISFSCNCVVNYVHSKLEGKATKGVTGPITFGEIAYQLLNQTLAYVTINDYPEVELTKLT